MGPLLIRLAFLAVASGFLSFKFNSIVPEPYLDEVFHIPQAQRYCEGRFMEWDNKITTPFGLYLLSYVYTRILSIIASIFGRAEYDVCSAPLLRLMNAFGVTIVIPAIGYRICRIHGARKEDAAETAFSIAFFPLLFFFGGLYYTDVWSTIFILVACNMVLEGKNWMAAICSAISITFRQTNVLWTVFFCLTATLSHFGKTSSGIKPGNIKGKDPAELNANSGWGSVLEASWSKGEIYNPSLMKAGLSDSLKSPLSLALAVMRDPLGILPIILPYMSVVAGFIAFVVWNGGIVLGDKSAHVATIHIPQLFYFAIFTLFMSWPLIITPSLPSHFFTENFPIIFNASGAGPIIRLQRSLLSLGILCGMLLAVHKNTILHPYLLADNRHYPFYLFRRTVLLHPYIKYLGVPIYYGAGWSVLDVLSRKPRISILLVIGWAGAVIGSIIGAGLVEFRYFIGGWALWRIAVGEESKQGGSSTWRWLLEIVWFAMINVATGWLFLRKGFVWENEPGKIQRFMCSIELSVERKLPVRVFNPNSSEPGGPDPSSQRKSLFINLITEVMALPTEHLAPSEIAFLCESHPITIIPRARMEGLHLISGYIPPFNPPQRTSVPLWLALLLKKQKKCNIVPPEWLNCDNLERLIRVETEQRERFVGGDELPFTWLEVAELLVEWAGDDIGAQMGGAGVGMSGAGGNTGGEDIRVLLRNLREIRWSKAREGLRQLESTYLQMNGLGHLEISELRPFAKVVVDNLRHIGSSREEAKAREEEEEEEERRGGGGQRDDDDGDD